MNRLKKIGLIKALTVLSILVVLSGMAAMTSADGWQSRPNEFYGTVTLNGADAPVGTVINAYIDGNSAELLMLQRLANMEGCQTWTI